MGQCFFIAIFCLLAQSTYFGPDKPVPGNPKLVRVQLLIKDSPNPAGLQIVRVNFAGHDVPLKPRGIDGNRGEASFQLSPGKYKLKWVVNRTDFAWPRTVSHEEIVEISPRDFWIQISIVGESATIA